MFCKKKPTNCQTLGEKRQNILHSFVQAQNDLTELIAEQENYGQEISESIKALQNEQSCNDLDVKTSKSILSKINNLLN